MGDSLFMPIIFLASRIYNVHYRRLARLFKLMLPVAIFLVTMQATPCYNSKKSVTIPFVLVESRPVVDFVLSGKDEVFHVFFGVSFNSSFIYETGVAKSVGDKAVLYQVAEEKSRELFPDASEDEIHKNKETLIDSGKVFMTFSELQLNGARLFDEKFVFDQYGNTKYSDSVDGVLALSAFSSERNLIIDYVNQEIILNGETICEEYVPMRKVEWLCGYVIPIQINGVSQEALVDIDSTEVFVRDNYLSESVCTDDELLECFTLEVPLTDYWTDSVEVKIGSQTAVHRVFKTTDSSIPFASNVARALGSRINLLGYAAFKNAKIQFDFENGVFRVVGFGEASWASENN